MLERESESESESERTQVEPRVRVRESLFNRACYLAASRPPPEARAVLANGVNQRGCCSLQVAMWRARAKFSIEQLVNGRTALTGDSCLVALELA